MCVCCICECTSVQMRVHVFGCVIRMPELTQGKLLSLSLYYLLKQNLLMYLELTDLASLANQLFLGIPHLVLLKLEVQAGNYV